MRLRRFEALFIGLLGLACDGVGDGEPFGGADPGPCRDGRFVGLDCYSGPEGTAGVGPCRGATVAVCEGGEWICDGEVVPRREVCDRVDNDCDGKVDEDVRAEVCDYLDNDCDGEVDEGVREADGRCVTVRCVGDGREECFPPPSECSGALLVYWTNGVCDGGACRWQEEQQSCGPDAWCYDGHCEVPST